MNKLKAKTSNVRAIIRSDINRLTRSVVSIICVLGVALIPCLYAWFNIISNWDPYTQESTQNLQIVVASDDKGTTFLGMDFNIGDIIIEKLKSNDQLSWQFADSAQEVRDELYSGKYYAGIVIPETFSADMLGFMDGELENPKIIYYDNQKLNAVASRVTDKAKSTVKDQINSIFLATIVEKLSTFTSVLSDVSGDTGVSLDKLNNDLEDIKTDLRAYVAIMDSMAAVTQSAYNVTTMTGALLPDVADMLKSSRQSVSDMSDHLATTKQDVILSADAIRNTSEQVRNALRRFDEKTGGDPASYFDWQTIYERLGITPEQGDVLQNLYTDVYGQLKDSTVRFEDILQQTSIDSDLINSMTSLERSLDNLDSLLAAIESDVGGQSYTLSQFSSALSSCTDSINGTRNVMSTMLDLVTKVQNNINELRSSEAITELIDLMQHDIPSLVEHIASPANLETVRVYSVEHFGSSMAPFYTVLAVWASALLCVSFIHTHIKNKREFPNLTITQAYFGRLFVFFALGQLTALITVLGNLFYIGIQCYTPFQFWLAAALAALVATLINYGLVFAFGNVGEAFAIIALVIQVAGSGGTYPMEMLPRFFRVLYDFMPFKYSMIAMRETIAGRYDGAYIKSMLVLLMMAAISIPAAIILHRLFRPLLRRFTESKSKTSGLMHGG